MLIKELYFLKKPHVARLRKKAYIITINSVFYSKIKTWQNIKGVMRASGS